MQLKHKQNLTLLKFFYHGVFGGYLNNRDIWDMQLDVLVATGAITYEQATGPLSFLEYQQYKVDLIDSYRHNLDTMWKDQQHGGWKRPSDTEIQTVVADVTAKSQEMPCKPAAWSNDDPPRLAQCVAPLIEAILNHDGGPELKERDDYQGFLEAKKTAYAPYTSDDAFYEDRKQCGEALGRNMKRFLRQSDSGNAELARCVMDWAYAAFAMWHAGQYRYQRAKIAKKWFTGQQHDEMVGLVNHTAIEVFNIGYAIPVDLLSWPDTVSAADRFMAAYSTGEFPIDFTRDKIQADKREIEQLPEEIRGCLERGARSSRAWQRAFAAVGDRMISERLKGQQEHE